MHQFKSNDKIRVELKLSQKFIVVGYKLVQIKKCCLNFQVGQFTGEGLDVPDDELPVPGHGGDGAHTLLAAIMNPQLGYL